MVILLGGNLFGSIYISSDVQRFMPCLSYLICFISTLYFYLIVKHSLFCFVHKNLDVLQVITVLDQQTAFAMETAFGQTNV